MGGTGRGAVDRAITPGSDFLQLNVADAPAGGRCDWLTGQLRNAIADGRLPVGSRLPASRALAGELGVSRGVVTEAYQRLSEDGHVTGRGRGGTVVVAAPAGQPPAGQPPALARPGEPGSPGGAEARAAGARAAEVVGAGVSAAQPGAGVFDSLRAIPARIDLSPGVPDLAAFPRAAWLRAERAVLGDLSPADFGYGDPRGAPGFRLAVARWLARNR